MRNHPACFASDISSADSPTSRTRATPSKLSRLIDMLPSPHLIQRMCSSAAKNLDSVRHKSGTAILFPGCGRNSMPARVGQRSLLAGGQSALVGMDNAWAWEQGIRDCRKAVFVSSDRKLVCSASTSLSAEANRWTPNRAGGHQETTRSTFIFNLGFHQQEQPISKEQESEAITIPPPFNPAAGPWRWPTLSTRRSTQASPSLPRVPS